MRLLAAAGVATGVFMLACGGTRLHLSRFGVRVGGIIAGAITVSLVFALPLWLPLGVGAVAIAGRDIRLRVRRGRVRRETDALWPDFLAMVRSRIATGEPLPDAVRQAGRSTGGRFVGLDRAWGGEFGGGLRAIQEEWADSTADRVFTTLRVAAETGGAQVDAILSGLAVSLSEELRLQQAHRAAISQQQMTAGIALVAPWLILAVSLATNPQAAEAFSTDAGRSILLFGAMATGLGYVLARRAVRLSRPPRVFS